MREQRELTSCCMRGGVSGHLDYYTHSTTGSFNKDHPYYKTLRAYAGGNLRISFPTGVCGRLPGNITLPCNLTLLCNLSPSAVRIGYRTVMAPDAQDAPLTLHLNLRISFPTATWPPDIMNAHPHGHTHGLPNVGSGTVPGTHCISSCERTSDVENQN